MTGLNVARVAKLIALFGFFLPWVLVSCSGEPVGRLSGIDLATGGFHPHGSPNFWVVLSLAAVIGGLVASFLMGRQAILGVGAAALVALVAGAIGVASISSSAQDGSPQSVAALGQVNLQYGFFITVGGLVAAIAACGVALAGRQRDGP